VMNIPSMTGISDIPDWCHIEAVGTEAADAYALTGPCKAASDAELVKMRQCSPIAHIDKVRAPCLVCLGGADRRVPPSQGIEYYHMLKSRKVATKLLFFPDDVHSIAKPASEAEHWLAIAEWIETHFPAPV
jgi:acylaminoacyl-peptidase